METGNQNPVVTLTPNEAQHKKDATTAMILSIVGLGLTLLPALNIAGFILSIIGYVRSRSNRAFAATQGIAENNMNSAGYVCGLIGVIAGAVTIVVTILCLVLFCAVAGSFINLVVLPEIL